MIWIEGKPQQIQTSQQQNVGDFQDVGPNQGEKDLGSSSSNCFVSGPHTLKTRKDCTTLHLFLIC